MRILVINGPNLNMLGKREPDIYGKETYEDLVNTINHWGIDNKVGVEVEQSNHEGDIIDLIQNAPDSFDAILINPGAFTHYSYGILDAMKSVEIPIVEVHISNIHGRESFRSHSVTAPAASGIIAGFGTSGYLIGLNALKNRK